MKQTEKNEFVLPCEDGQKVYSQEYAVPGTAWA